MVKSLSGSFIDFLNQKWLLGREVPNRNVSDGYPRVEPWALRINIRGIRSTAQMYGVGENPLNGKGVAAALLRAWLRNSLVSMET